MAVNVFAPKKKYNQQGQLMSSQQPIQGSGYSSAYASNASTYKAPTTPAVKASSYNTQNYLSSLTKQPTIQTQQKPQMSVAPKQPVKIQTPNILPWGTNTGAMPWGQKQPQTATPRVTGQMSTPRPVGGMSVAPKTPQMSVDPNYRKPEPIRQVEAPQPEQPAFNMMDFLSGSADRRANFAQKSLNDENSFIKQKYGLANEQLRTQLPIAQERFGQFKGDTEAMIADLIAGGERQKGQTEDYYGDAQRQAAQTLRETQGRDQRTFANLGTLDSRGEGSFAQANENTTSEFNRFTQQTLRAKADKLSEIESAVRTGERQAKQVILQEQQKLEDLARNIEFAVQNNNLQEAKDLTDAFNQTQNYIYDIEDNLASAQYEFAKAQQDLLDEIAKTQSFTPEFMATGNPTNQAEYEFIIKNQKDASQYYGTAPSGGKLTEKQMAYQAAGNIAQNALTKLNSGNVSTGIGNKFFGGIGETLGTNSPEQQAYRSDLAAMRTAIQNALLGANMSPKEMEQIMAAIPQYNDAPSIAKSKLQSLITNLPIMAGNFQQAAPTSGVDINELLAQYGG